MSGKMSQIGEVLSSGTNASEQSSQLPRRNRIGEGLFSGTGWQESFKANVRRRNALRIAEKYGVELTHEDPLYDRILKAEGELLSCQSCDGYPCRKNERRYSQPIIDVSRDEFERRTCWAYEQRQKNWINQARIPAQYMGKTFADYAVTLTNKRAVGLSHCLIEGSLDKGIYLYGSPGTGKTFLASLMGKYYLEAGQRVIFGDVPSLLARIKETFDKPGQSGQDVIKRYETCDLLILDDLGVGQMTDWNVGIVYQLINTRYNANRTVVVTSNYSPDDLQNVLSKGNKMAAERIVSRLHVMTYAAYLGFQDRRRRTV